MKLLKTEVRRMQESVLQQQSSFTVECVEQDSDLIKDSYDKCHQLNKQDARARRELVWW